MLELLEFAVAIPALLLGLRLKTSVIGSTVTWDCGYARAAATMQYTSSSYAQMLVELFQWSLRPKLNSPRIQKPFPTGAEFRFAPFVSEFQLVAAAFEGGHYWAGGIFVSSMLFVFFGMGYAVVSICFGQPTDPITSHIEFRDNLGTGLPMIVSLALVLLLGVYNPPELHAMLQAAADVLYTQP